MNLQLPMSAKERTVRSRRGRVAYRVVTVPAGVDSIQYDAMPRSILEILEDGKLVADMQLGLNVPQNSRLSLKDMPGKADPAKIVGDVKGYDEKEEDDEPIRGEGHKVIKEIETKPSVPTTPETPKEETPESSEQEESETPKEDEPKPEGDENPKFDPSKYFNEGKSDS